MSVQNKDKKKFLFTFKGEMKKGELITKYYQGNLENLVICSPFNKDKIAKNLCGLSNSEGGSIFFGLNDNFIEGINSFPDGEKMTGEKWILEITKLSQMLFNTVTKKSIKIDNKKRFYNNYKVIDENNNESYLTEIVVLNDSDKLYYKDVEYVRKSGETIRVDGKVSSGSSSGSDGEIELPLIPEILSEDVVNLKEGIFNHENSPYEIGNIFNAFEGQNLEYKENVECLNLGQYPIIKYISGFANTKGGKVVVGIKDNREIVGVSIPDEKRDKITLGITNRISLNCSKQSFLTFC